MAHIVEFSIDGLAGRKTVYSQKLNRDINIFYGLNGSGKTSLIKILHSALSNNSAVLKNVPFKSAEVKFYSINYDKVFTRTIDQTAITEPEGEDQLSMTTIYLRGGIDSDVIQGSQTYSPSKTTWQTKPLTKRRSPSGFSHRYLPTSRLYIGMTGVRPRVETASLAPFIFSEDQLDLFFASALDGLWSRYSADILSIVRKAQEDGLASILRAVISQGTQKKPIDELDPDVAFNRVKAFLTRQNSSSLLGSLTNFKKRYQKESQLRSIVSDINEVEKKVEDAIAPRDKLQNLIQNMFSGNKTILFEDSTINVVTSDGINIGLKSLSSGEKQLVRICVETLLASSNSILVDEPEISMHIDWQKQLIAVMRQLNPTVQLILATHSPEIMADVEDEKIFPL